MKKYKFTRDGLSDLDIRELVEIAADMDIPYRLEFPKAQLVVMILRGREGKPRVETPRRPRKLTPHAT